MTDTTIALLASLGRYEFRDRLGSGGMARVYQAFDTKLDRLVAIKLLHDHLSEDPTFKERFEREAKLIAGLNHPNIVQVYDFSAIERADQRVFYMVMSYVPGTTLQAELQRLQTVGQIMDQERVMAIMLNVADALGYAHSKGMVHRDVKPANIILNGQQAILTDFGIARMMLGSNLTQDGITVGTPTYMSPEQATGETIDARSDIYALGIILYEMLAGRPPFSDEGGLSILLKHLNDPVPSLSTCAHIDNPFLDHVVFKALAKNPEARYQSAAEFAHDLKRAFAGEMPQTGTGVKKFSSKSGTRATIQIPIPPPAFRSPAAILAVGFAVIALLLMVGLINQQRRSDTPSTTPNSINSVEGMTGSVESMTGELYFVSTFDPNSMFNDYWPQSDLGQVSREITPEGNYSIQSRLSSRAVATIFDASPVYEDVTIQMTAALQPGSASTGAYGIIFRYIDDNNYNVFAVDGLGRFSIWTREQGTWRELRQERETWTSNPIIGLAGEPNNLFIQVQGNELIGFVNGEIVTMVEDDTLDSGRVGIYIATPDQGSTHVLVDTYMTIESTLSLADSMTGDEDTPQQR